jgi:hypothetical protein
MLRSQNLTEEEREYVSYLSEIYDAPDYGLLLYKGDPIQFEVGLNEWIREGKYQG